MVRWVGRLLLLAALAGQPAHAGSVTSVFPDPGLTVPRLRFATGRVVRNAPALFPAVPDIPGPVSPWRVLEWRKRDVLRPWIMTRNDASAADPLLGTPSFTFRAKGSRLSIFPHDRAWVYELASDGGIIDAAGGSNIFLSVRATNDTQTFDRVMTYSLRLGLSRAKVEAFDPRAIRTGAVLAQVFSGFSIAFQDPRSGARASVFLQIGHADSRGDVPTHRGCTMQAGRRQIVYTGILPGDVRLAFEPAAGRPLRAASYNLNHYLCEVLSQPFQCQAADGSFAALAWPPAARDFRNWRLREMYVGLETEDTDLRPSALSNQPQGHVEAALQLSDLRVLRDASTPYDQTRCRF